MNGGQTALYWGLLLVGAALFLLLPLPVGLVREARYEGLVVSWSDLLAMRLRKVDPRRILAPALAAHRAGVAVAIQDLEAHHLAGGDPSLVVEAVIGGRRQGLDVPFEVAAAWDLAGRDPVDGARRWAEAGARPALEEIARQS